MSDRRVHFAVPIHRIEYLDKEWENASQVASDGSYWASVLADRQRFKDRIERVSETLTRILDFEFRQKIYGERFENFHIPEQKANTTVTSELSSTIATSETSAEEIIGADASQSQHKSHSKFSNKGTRRRRKRRNRRKRARSGAKR